MRRELIEHMKNKYPSGTRVELIEMEGEPQMQKGLQGTVVAVDDIGQIHVQWDNGSTLALNKDADRFSTLEPEATFEQTM